MKNRGLAGNPWKVFFPIILISLAVITAGPVIAGAKRNIKPGGDSGAPPTLEFAIAGANLPPGSIGVVTITASDAIPASQGRLVVTFNPPVFIDNPWLHFLGENPRGLFTLTPAGPGIYYIDFDSPSYPVLDGEGNLFMLSGAVDQTHSIGEPISISIDPTLNDSAGQALPAEGLISTFSTTLPVPGIILRVDGNSVPPGTSEVNVEIRTYNPKPIKQGQICMTFDPTIFSRVTSVTVNGAEPDVTISTDLSVPGRVDIFFSSANASINRLDGSMITVGLKFHPNIPAGTVTLIDVDSAGTLILDQNGVAIPFTPRQGRVKIEDPGP